MTDTPRKGMPTGTHQHLFMDDDLDEMDNASLDDHEHQIETDGYGHRACMICRKSFDG